MTRIALIIVASLLAITSFSVQPAVAAEQQSILVTGASTGIGRNLAETLARNGYHVYAGARKAADINALTAIENITAVRLDVTKQDEVDAVVAQIEASGTGLYGLVNNAGIGDGGPIVETPIAEQTLVYQINVEGVYRTTQAFAPLVMESKGRIATTGSIAGTLAWAGGSAYSGSKHWIEAFTDSLAAEMAPHGVSVSVIEPGNFQSFIRRSAAKRKMARVQAAGGEITPEMEAGFEQTVERELSFKQPDEVSAAFMHALFDDTPLRRYVVAPNADEQQRTIATKIQQLVELNSWGPHAYDRDELVKMLDAALLK
ncbi:MAG: SDR family NAD(P)-dependent oxidoreductase [Woeseiaceae bacterium]